jgi:hypothetical protein
MALAWLHATYNLRSNRCAVCVACRARVRCDARVLQAEKIAALERLAAAPRGTIHWWAPRLQQCRNSAAIMQCDDTAHATLQQAT